MAKRLKRNLRTKENRDYWDFVERTAAEVKKWPAWKIGGRSIRGKDAKTKAGTE